MLNWDFISRLNGEEWDPHQLNPRWFSSRCKKHPKITNYWIQCEICIKIYKKMHWDEVRPFDNEENQSWRC